VHDHVHWWSLAYLDFLQGDAQSMNKSTRSGLVVASAGSAIFFGGFVLGSVSGATLMKKAIRLRMLKMGGLLQNAADTIKTKIEERPAPTEVLEVINQQIDFLTIAVVEEFSKGSDK
jgi:hypothetical protein